jgi:hypothetical protein
MISSYKINKLVFLKLKLECSGHLFASATGQTFPRTGYRLVLLQRGQRVSPSSLNLIWFVLHIQFVSISYGPPPPLPPIMLPSAYTTTPFTSNSPLPPPPVILPSLPNSFFSILLYIHPPSPPIQLKGQCHEIFHLGFLL